MIIDFHTHIFPDKIAGATIEKLSKASDSKAYTDGTKDGLQKSMEESGVDISVVLPVVTKPQQFSSINRYAREITPEQFRGGGEFLSFGGIHPDTENYKAEVDEIADMGLKGIKLHPDYQRVFIDDIRYMRIMDRAAERGLIVIAHAGVDVGLPEVVHCTPKRVEHVLDQIDGGVLVMAHMGGWNCWEDVEKYLAGSRLYFDTAYSLGHMEDEQFLRLSRKHGVDKILFATDSPWDGQKEFLSRIREMNMKEDEKKAILGENARRILKL